MPAGNAAGVVYGVITVGALMAAESGRHESYVDSIASALIATLLYWLAHAYADLLGRRLATGERLTARDARARAGARLGDRPRRSAAAAGAGDRVDRRRQPGNRR